MEKMDVVMERGVGGNNSNMTKVMANTDNNTNAMLTHNGPSSDLNQLPTMEKPHSFRHVTPPHLSEGLARKWHRNRMRLLRKHAKSNALLPHGLDLQDQNSWRSQRESALKRKRKHEARANALAKANGEQQQQKRKPKLKGKQLRKQLRKQKQLQRLDQELQSSLTLEEKRAWAKARYNFRNTSPDKSLSGAVPRQSADTAGGTKQEPKPDNKLKEDDVPMQLIPKALPSTPVHSPGYISTAIPDPFASSIQEVEDGLSKFNFNTPLRAPVGWPARNTTPPALAKQSNFIESPPQLEPRLRRQPGPSVNSAAPFHQTLAFRPSLPKLLTLSRLHLKGGSQASHMAHKVVKEANRLLTQHSNVRLVLSKEDREASGISPESAIELE